MPKFTIERTYDVLPYGCIMAGEFDWREAGKRLGDMA
jgi:hypothetical protein